MKPTQEQLNDPKWWDENAPEDCDLFYEDERFNYWFAQSESSHSCHSLLAKRPTKPAFVPEVGVECAAAIVADVMEFHTITVNYISDDICVYELKGKECVKNTGMLEFRPIKSERELFVETAIKTLTGNRYKSLWAGALYDSGLFCLKEADK